jgi:hypothetical protein
MSRAGACSRVFFACSEHAWQWVCSVLPALAGARRTRLAGKKMGCGCVLDEAGEEAGLLQPHTAKSGGWRSIFQNHLGKKSEGALLYFASCLFAILFLKFTKAIRNRRGSWVIELLVLLHESPCDFWGERPNPARQARPCMAWPPPCSPL